MAARTRRGAKARHNRPINVVPPELLTPAELERRLLEAEAGATTTIQAVIESGRPDGFRVLEFTLAAIFARILAVSDFIPVSPDEAPALVSLDDQLDGFGRNTRVFYTRALERLRY